MSKLVKSLSSGLITFGVIGVRVDRIKLEYFLEYARNIDLSYE
jgi:hypothetical protein